MRWLCSKRFDGSAQRDVACGWYLLTPRNWMTITRLVGVIIATIRVAVVADMRTRADVSIHQRVMRMRRLLVSFQLQHWRQSFTRVYRFKIGEVKIF